MKARTENLMSAFSQIGFGAVSLSGQEKKFRSELNDEIISLCKSLPQSTQVDALFFIMHYWGIEFGQELDFFSYYYVPSWSIIYWLIHSTPKSIRLKQAVKRSAKTAHAMTLFLHALDDHLNDSEIPTTHLSLLLRSESWRIMNDALYSLADGVDGGHEIVQGFIDDYYSSIISSRKVESLDSYCGLFRKQIATWLIVPTLMTKKVTSDARFTDAIQTSLGSFTIAWRLLDDIQDIKKDMINSVHSSIYICLSPDLRIYWDKDNKEKKNQRSGCGEAILNYISENRVIERIMDRICLELNSAASIADNYNLTGLADEYRSLLTSLRKQLDLS
jgi:hypothetical protein